jgi:hypothetical protein
LAATTIVGGAPVANETINNFYTYINTTGAYAPTIANKVIKYTVKNSTGKISSITLLQPANSTNLTNLEYRGNTSKLGNYTIATTSEILDATNAGINSYSKFASTSFKDKEKYDAAIFTDANFANTAVFTVLTRAGFTINGNSRFAVVRKRAAQSQTADGDRCYSLNVLYEGEEKDILCAWDGSGVTGLAPGDAFFFKTDSDGLVERVWVVYNGAAQIADSWNNTVPNTNFSYDIPSSGTPLWGFVQYQATPYTIYNDNAEYQLVYGIITNVTSKGVEFAANGLVTTFAAPIDLDENVGTGTDAFNVAGANSYDQGTPAGADSFIDIRNAADIKVYGMDSDCVNYRYASGEYTGTNIYKGITVGAPTASPISAYETGRNTSIYNLEGKSDKNGINRLTYALALVHNGDIVEIYTITQ